MVLAETSEVVEIAQIVKCFVGVFNGDLLCSDVGEVVVKDGVVEARAITAALKGREDDELGDSRAAG